MCYTKINWTMVVFVSVVVQFVYNFLQQVNITVSFLQAFNTADEAWRGYIIMAHAIIDREAAWNEAMQLTSYDDGNTKSNTLYWIATRP